MRIEIIIFLITALIIANIYTDGKIVKLLLSWKKYYQMAAIAFAGFALYWLIKKNPLQAKEMVMASNEYIKYLPIDSGTSSLLSPILDFTAKQSFRQDYSAGHPVLPMESPNPKNQYERKLMQSGVQGIQVVNGGGRVATKRSVSETKKKFVAARQNWHCGDCQNQLSAWFEVDHKIRLEYGGSNHVDNLVALCRECHGKKTAMENL